MTLTATLWVVLPVAGAAQAAPATSAAASAACASTKVTLHPNQGKFGGIVPPAHQGSSESSAPAGCQAAAAAFNGSPPLLYGGAGVMGAPGPITVTPVFWTGALTFPATYKSIIDTYLANVAADSGKATNVFATTTQYTAGAAHIQYNVVAGTPLTDTNVFPTGGCTPDTGSWYSDASGYSKCVTDGQLQAELHSFVTAHSLAADTNHLYIAFLPKGVESCFTGENAAANGQCSANTFCGYHSAAFGSLVYASMPYAVVDGWQGTTCSSDGGGVGNQSPNGSIDADTEISITSHEMAESFTDPFPNGGWVDSSGSEIGDDCAYIYGSGFGGVSGSQYNQTINGARYFTQTEFSNQDYAKTSATSCIQKEDLPTAAFTVTTPAPAAQSPVSFDGSASAELDNSAANAISSYSWNFGDGSPAGSAAQPSHTYAATGSYQVTLTVTDVDSFQATVTHTVAVGLAPPAITSANHATFAVGTAGSFTVTASGAPAPTFALSGTLPAGVGFNTTTGVLSGTPATGTVGAWPVTFTASNGSGTPATQSFTLTVAKGTPTLSWATPADIVYGTALSSTQLDATSPVPGAFGYSPVAGSVLPAGANQTLSVTFTPTDTANYAVTATTVKLNITKATLTVRADNSSRPQGVANPTFTYQITGFAALDPPTVVTGAPVLSTTATSSSPAGTYPINVAAGTLAAANYTFALSAATLSVTSNHATFINPTPGQANIDLTAPFTWTAAAGAQAYILLVGTTSQGSDLLNSGLLPASQTSFSPPALPSGRTLYATLLTEVGGVWNFQAITFTAAPLRASFTYPLNGATNVDTTHLFTWAAMPLAQAFIVQVGTTAYGHDLANSGLLAKTATSFDVGALPTGRTLYASLFTEAAGAWNVQLISFTAAAGEATFTYPTNGQVNVSSSHPFTWATLPSGQGYIVVIGTTANGVDVFNSGVLPAGQSSVAVPALPKNKLLYATLLTKVNGAFSRAQTIVLVATS
ncbi:MAG TPA: PKD domain-containing protein [Acidimicrobiales bacterium]|nr:PKD domain-containing protein [Acidimicrobiales bacterium]